jgi:hypothetical protein
MGAGFMGDNDISPGSRDGISGFGDLAYSSGSPPVSRRNAST